MKHCKSAVKNKFNGILLCLSLFLLIPSLSYGYGLGATVYRGTGNFNFTSKPYLFPEEKATGRIDKTGFGIIFDSNLASDLPYGYRIGLNVEKADLDSSDFNHGEALLCFNADLALTFGLVRRQLFRIWAAPEMRFGTADGDGAEFTEDASARVIGFGFLMGTNIHAFDSFDFSMAAGVRMDLYRADSQSVNYKELNGHAAYAYLMATVFFRSSDDKYN